MPTPPQPRCPEGTRVSRPSSIWGLRDPRGRGTGSPGGVTLEQEPHPVHHTGTWDPLDPGLAAHCSAHLFATITRASTTTPGTHTPANGTFKVTNRTVSHPERRANYCCKSHRVSASLVRRLPQPGTPWAPWTQPYWPAASGAGDRPRHSHSLLTSAGCLTRVEEGGSRGRRSGQTRPPSPSRGTKASCRAPWLQRLGEVARGQPGCSLQSCPLPTVPTWARRPQVWLACWAEAGSHCT